MLSASTTSTATIIANSTIGSASSGYQVYLNIKSNNYVYTKDANTLELLLKVVDNSNT